MIILLTGASGLVGGAVARLGAARGHYIAGTVGTFSERVAGLASQHCLDLLDPGSLVPLLERLQPDAIINAAAVSEPADCEADPKRSTALNVELPARLADVAAVRGMRLIHLSSEQVFDGTRAPYSPTDPPSPLNRYGQQKFESERRLAARAPTLAAVVRAPLLMGNSPRGRRSLHERLFAAWVQGLTTRLFADEFRQPCTALSLAAVLLELCAHREACGVFHWAGAELLSRYDQGIKLRKHFGLTDADAPILKTWRADLPDPSATRPANLGLNLEPLVSLLRIPPQSFAEQLQELAIPPWAESWFHQRHTGYDASQRSLSS